LAWVATRDEKLAVWLAATIILGAVDGRLCGRLLADLQSRWLMAAACAGQFLSATSFAALTLLLLNSPSPIRLAGTTLVLCAACLNNAMMACGSRRATALLVGPASILLILSPFVARYFGVQISVADSLLLALGGAGYTVFIVRLVAGANAESQALRHTMQDLAWHSAIAMSASRDALESKQRWRMIFDHSPLARLCFDAGRLHSLLRAQDPACEARLGDLLAARVFSVAELFSYITLVQANQVADDLCGRRLTEPHFTERFLPAFCQALNEVDVDGALPVFTAQLICATGEILEVEVHVRLAPDRGPAWSLCLATYVDVTEARRAAREQQEALLAAEIANRAKSDFLAVMSHEIRTPLNGVLGMAQAMELGALPRPQRERLKVIRESGSALLEIVDDLLDLSKIEVGEIALEHAEFDLAAVVESAHGGFAAEAARKGLDYSLTVERGAQGAYHGDAGRIRQVVCNLISNALKFTHQGEVAVRLSRTVSGVCCEVRDTGIGIAPGRVERLFEKFVQADTSTTRRYGGTGLGLAICRQLCEVMGGTISVSSQLGQGSSFVIDLPLRPGATGAGQLPTAPNGAAMRILAAEDNPVNQMVLKALLAQIGLEPTFVENGAEALRAWEDGHWDLVLMDVQMPLMDGPTATRLIRTREAELGRRPTPIVALTANAMTHQVVGYLAAGMNEVIGKPINVDQLFAVIASAAGAPAEEPARVQAAS
jgi:signal transduction histidine kinase/ActR/RegA family two-component response regulator